VRVLRAKGCVGRGIWKGIGVTSGDVVPIEHTTVVAKCFELRPKLSATRQEFNGRMPANASLPLEKKKGLECLVRSLLSLETSCVEISAVPDPARAGQVLLSGCKPPNGLLPVLIGAHTPPSLPQESFR